MSKLLKQLNKESHQLKDLTSLVSRGITPSYVEGDGITVLNQKCIRNWVISYLDSRLTDKTKINSKNKMLEIGDILVCSTGVGTLGRVAQVNTLDKPTIVDSHVSIIRPESKKVNPYFLGYIIKKSEKIIESLAEGSTGQTELPRTKLEEFELELPPRTAQNQIVNIIKNYDTKIENSNKIIKNLELTAQTIFNEWFVNFKFTGYEKVKMIESEMGEIPEGWNVGNIETICNRLPSGKVFKESDLSVNGTTPVYDQSSKGTIGSHNEDPAFNADINNPTLTFGDHTCRVQLICEPFSLGPNTIPLSEKNNYSPIFTFFLIKDLIEQREYKRHWNELVSNNLIIPNLVLVNEFVRTVKPFIKEINFLEKENISLKSQRDQLLAKLI